MAIHISYKSMAYSHYSKHDKWIRYLNENHDDFRSNMKVNINPGIFVAPMLHWYHQNQNYLT